jgi:hypothetical protein
MPCALSVYVVVTAFASSCEASQLLFSYVQDEVSLYGFVSDVIRPSPS